MEEFKRTTKDPHWPDIDPAQLEAEDESYWRRVQDDTISGEELRHKANEVMEVAGARMRTDARSNFYAYLINVLSSRLAKIELVKLRASK
jgi:hypothetical protein